MLFKGSLFLFYSNLENWCDGKVDRWLNWQNTRVSSTKSRYVTAQVIHLLKTISMTYLQVCGDYIFSLINEWNFIKILLLKFQLPEPKWWLWITFPRWEGPPKMFPIPSLKAPWGNTWSNMARTWGRIWCLVSGDGFYLVWCLLLVMMNFKISVNNLNLICIKREIPGSDLINEF